MATPTSSIAQLWRPGDPDSRPRVMRDDGIYRPEVLKTIETTISDIDADLRHLSLDISDHPELSFEEIHAHDVLTSFMSKHGFEVTTHYLLDTAWKAEYSHGQGGRTIGVNSEMDALPGIGHACGHNLIAIAGVAVAIAIKAAMEKWDISGRVILLGTPAEEGGCGKFRLLECGAYEGMDICLMCHPAPGPRHSVSLSGSLALTCIQVEYAGHTAHASLSPWEGQNALDAAVLAYTNVSLLRQQLKPTHRVHGIFSGQDWATNIIPDNATMNWDVRAPTWAEVEVAAKRVKACIEAAALATSCTVKIEELAMRDLKQNKALGDEVANIVKKRYGQIDYEWGISGASTDFGDITYALPSLHPGFAIPAEVGGGNHTAEFTRAARTPEAHQGCLDVSKALAAAGMRVLTDNEFFVKVKETYVEEMKD